MRYVFFLLTMLLVVGCASGPRIPLDLGALTTAQYGMNISADDLLIPTIDPLVAVPLGTYTENNEPTPPAASRLIVYLDELVAAGYAKQIRIILPPDWGPQIYHDWWPVIRAKGFKVIAILGQEKRDSADMSDQAQAWARHILLLVKDDLLGVQIVNEAWGTFTPSEYVSWHQIMAPIIRQFAPGVPIVAGDVDPVISHLNWWERVMQAGIEFDVVSLHVTDFDKEVDLSALAQRLSRLHGPGAAYWITEGGYGHLPWLTTHGLNVRADFIYGWNTRDGHARRPGGPLP